MLRMPVTGAAMVLSTPLSSLRKCGTKSGGGLVPLSSGFLP